MTKLCAAFASACLVLTAPVLSYGQGDPGDKPLGATAQQAPAYLKNAGLEQQLGHSLPMDSTFVDETGRTGPLKSWYEGRPVVMALEYYKCMMLCPMIVQNLAKGLSQVTLKPGTDYDVLIFSFDPSDTPTDALEEKKHFVDAAGSNAKAGAVHFLTATQPSIDALSNATGFHFVKVPGPDGKLNQFAHSSVIMFTTPDGKMSKYLTGVEYDKRDLRMALLDASQKKISNPMDLVILYCCNYSPSSGKYTVAVMRILGIAGMVTIAIVSGILYLLIRKPKKLRMQNA